MNNKLKKLKDKNAISKEERQKLILYSIQLSVIVATITCVITVIATCYFFILKLRSPQRQLEEQAILSDADVHNFLIDNNITTDEKGEDIIQYIKNYSIYDVGSEDLKDSIYKGIVRSLDDPYSEYITYEENIKKNETDSGEFVGIGVRVQKNMYNNTIRVVSVVPGGPAEKAGVRANDLIMEIDELNVDFIDSTEMTNMLRGEKGTSVKLKISRGDEDFEYDVIRDEVVSNLVEWKEITDIFQSKDRIVYTHLREFNGKAAEQINEVCDYMEKEGIKNMILDLRGNAGGDVDILEDIANNFIREGKIAEIRGKVELMQRDVVSKGSKHNFNVICLVDENSASASEMLSGSLRDINDTILIGEKTFGKGIAQTTVTLNDGSALKLTTAEYYLYNGECIHKIGITPDIVIEHNYVDDMNIIDSDEVIMKAVELFNNKLYKAKDLKE